MSRFRLVCAGCGTPAPRVDEEPYPFRCRSAGSAPDTDHVITKVLTGELLEWPAQSPEANPFIRYQGLLYSSDVASVLKADAACAFSRTAENLDDAVFRVCGQRFRVTPFGRQDALAAAAGFSAPGAVWVKDETNNVSGSHKGRHLAGIMLYLLQLGDQLPDLAIASCGNAALAAAVVARAANRPLRTFVPPDADATVIGQLEELGATIVTCPRRPGELGDPCYHRFQEAIAEGALPFCCQGPDNGLTIDGGETIAYEMVDQLQRAELDAIVIQVGGGALASACVQGFERAVALRRLAKMPRIYTVQTRGAAPLARAHHRLETLAAQIGIAGALRHAATHRSDFMWPWEQAPHSIAHGILDDETYDWLVVVKGMLETGGEPLVVDERLIAEANRLGRQTTGIDVDHTGSAGLAGLLALRTGGSIGANETVAVIFSGIRRGF
jgi:threonine synthase